MLMYTDGIFYIVLQGHNLSSGSSVTFGGFSERSPGHDNAIQRSTLVTCLGTTRSIFWDKGVLLGWDRLDAGNDTEMITIPPVFNFLLVDDDVSGPAPKMQKRYKTRLV
eukprot:GHVU01233957.1.p1 GENE.GHVU01233957.1~~GHVU01233957.1.p1  ORF type:complete len:109 (+),score=3.65 GHVU01233957.1:156-482(+)